MNFSVFTDVARGTRDKDDPESVTVSWAVKEGVVIEEAQVLEGTMFVLRLRIPEPLQDQLRRGEV